MGFAVDLRKPTVPKSEDPTPVPPPMMVKKVTVDGKRVKDEFAIKETNCTNSQCLMNNYTYAVEFQEVNQLATLPSTLCFIADSIILCSDKIY